MSKNDSSMRSSSSNSELLEPIRTNLPEDVTVAQGPNSYTLKVFNFLNGMVIVGYLLREDSSYLWVLRPMVADIDVDDSGTNVVRYGFVPYMNQISMNHPLTLKSIPISKGSVISVTQPSDHVAMHYNTVLHFNEKVSVDPEKPLYNPEPAANSRVLH